MYLTNFHDLKSYMSKDVSSESPYKSAPMPERVLRCLSVSKSKDSSLLRKKIFKKNKISHQDIIRKIVSLKFHANPLINLYGVYFKQSYTYQLVKNFTKNKPG